MTANLLFAWCWILLGLVSGVGLGLFFHRDQWLGGYGSWERRMMRLGHVAFFGTGVLNLMAAMTARVWMMAEPGGVLMRTCSVLLIVGAVTMSLVCFLAAWKKPLRNLFFIPVVSLVGGVGIFCMLVFRACG